MSPNKKITNLKRDLARGKELFNEGNYVDAKEIFESLYGTNPDDKEVQNYLGMVLYKLGLHNEAMELYKELLEKVPNFPSLHLNLGIIYYKEGLLELAFEEFLNTLEFDPTNKKAQNYIGLIHVAKGNFDEALATFELTGSKKMIKDTKEKIREAKREEYLKKKGGKVKSKEKEKDDDKAAAKEVSKGNEKLSFKDIKKSVEHKKQGDISSLKDISDELMRNIFTSGDDFLDTYKNLVRLSVKNAIYSKLSLLESFSGDLKFNGAHRIIQKKETDMFLGSADDNIFKINGKGSIVLSIGRARITPFFLEKEEFYVKEKHILAFENSIKYENSIKKLGDEFDLVKLTGKGTVILISDNTPITQLIDSDNPLAIKLEYIIGWYGKLSSKIIKGEESMFKRREDSKWVIFKGDGYVFCVVKD